MRIEPGLMLASGLVTSDAAFERTICLVLDAGAHGALGVVLNRLSEHDLAKALEGWADLATFPARLFDGGPVSKEGAICLATPASPDEEPPGWRQVHGRVGLLHLDTPIEIVRGAFARLRIFAGYVGWGPGQLEAGIAGGGWHPVQGVEADVFDPDPGTLWRRVLRRQEGDLALLSAWTPTPELN